MQWGPEAFDQRLLRCELVPELCGLPVESIVREPDLQTAIDVVFLSDGYTAATMPSYRDRVRELTEELAADTEGIVGRDPALFNFHRVDVVSPGPQLEARPLRSCVSALGVNGQNFLVGDDLRAERAAANAPAVDVVVVLVANSGDARGPVSQTLWGTDVIRMPHGDAHQVLTHELGHALIGLGDEYVEFDERHWLADRYERWTSSPLPPNLSLSPEGDWGGLVSGAIEGGGRFARGVYRPTNECRMLDAYRPIPFCPVCSAQVDLVLRGRRGLADGAPRCGIALGHARPQGPRDLLLFGRDGNGVVSLKLSTDGEAALDFPTSTFRPSASRPPVWAQLESGTSGSREVRLRCTDGQQAQTEVRLELGP